MPTTKSPLRTPCAVEIFDRALELVLGAFLRASQRRVSAGDDALHHLGIGAEGRRTLGRVEHAEAAGCSGADVEQASAGAKGRSRPARWRARWARAAMRRRRRRFGLRRS